jgi:phosphomannomutase
MVKDFPNLELIGGGEESFGYMVGDFVRDKDAVTATLLACEIAAQQKEKGSSLYEYLQEIFKETGYFQEHLVSLVKKGKKGAEEISEIMKQLRENPFTEIAGSTVVRLEDYNTGIRKNLTTGTSEKMDIPQSNVLIYYTEDGSKIAARPSGTEPKIKFYMSVQHQENAPEILQEKIKKISSHLNIV